MESLWKDKQFDVDYVEIGGWMWKLLEFLLTYKIDRNTTTTLRHYVNELVSHGTMGLNHEKLPSGWSLFFARRIFRGFQNYIFRECAMVA